MLKRRVVTGTILMAALAAGCNRGAPAARDPAEQATARADSTRKEQEALRDSGVSVDTQRIDTGGARLTPPASD
jgi:hypothetical protein